MNIHKFSTAILILLFGVGIVYATPYIADNSIFLNVTASFFRGDGSSIWNLNRSNVTGQVSFDELQNVTWGNNDTTQDSKIVALGNNDTTQPYLALDNVFTGRNIFNGGRSDFIVNTNTYTALFRNNVKQMQWLFYANDTGSLKGGELAFWGNESYSFADNNGNWLLHFGKNLDLKIKSIGYTLEIAEGAGGMQGKGVLASGKLFISNTNVNANTRCFVSYDFVGVGSNTGSLGIHVYSGNGIGINSTNVVDSNNIQYICTKAS